MTCDDQSILDGPWNCQRGCLTRTGRVRSTRVDSFPRRYGLLAPATHNTIEWRSCLFRASTECLIDFYRQERARVSFSVWKAAGKDSSERSPALNEKLGKRCDPKKGVHTRRPAAVRLERGRGEDRRQMMLVIKGLLMQPARLGLVVRLEGRGPSLAALCVVSSRYLLIRCTPFSTSSFAKLSPSSIPPTRGWNHIWCVCRSCPTVSPLMLPLHPRISRRCP